MARERLEAIKALVDNLEDRDTGIKRDMSLFESVFRFLPLPTAIWMADVKGLWQSRRVTEKGSNGWHPDPVGVDSIDATYHCPNLRDRLTEKMREAAEGKTVTFLCSSEGTCIWTKLIPKVIDNEVTGIVGLSLDISSIFGMASALRHLSDRSDLADKDREMIMSAIDSCQIVVEDRTEDK